MSWDTKDEEIEESLERPDIEGPLFRLRQAMEFHGNLRYSEAIAACDEGIKSLGDWFRELNPTIKEEKLELLLQKIAETPGPMAGNQIDALGQTRKIIHELIASSWYSSAFVEQVGGTHAAETMESESRGAILILMLLLRTTRSVRLGIERQRARLQR